MKKLILVSLISINAFCQSDFSKENISQYKRYKSIEHHPLINLLKSVYLLKDGKIIFSENYTNGEYRSKHKFTYNSNNDLIKDEIIYLNDSTSSNYPDLLIPTVLTNIYDDKNRLIEISIQEQNHPPTKEIYSDFNKLNLPQKKQIGTLITYEYSYDDKGRKATVKCTSNFLDEIKIEIVDYQYDKYNNIISLKRKLIPEEKFPIEIVGGRFKYEFEEFRYTYNKYGLWTEKFWVVNGEERLIEKRKFKK